MTSLEFAEVARRLGDVSRAAGHDAPSFRSPPRSKTCHRSLRRHARGVTVAVTLRGRPTAAVVADMIDGVIAANQLTGAPAGHLRDVLWTSVSGLLSPRPEEPLATVRPIRAA